MDSNAKKILKIVSLSVFAFFIITYTFFRSQDLIFGVKIIDVRMVTKTTPDRTTVRSGEKSTDSIIQITGNAKNAVNLTLDNRIISINQKGDFNETIALLSGYNIISIKAKDEFGNSDEKIYKLMY